MALNFKLGTLIMKVSVWSMKISVWTMKIRMSNTKEPYLPCLTSVSSVLFTRHLFAEICCHSRNKCIYLQLSQFD